MGTQSTCIRFMPWASRTLAFCGCPPTCLPGSRAPASVDGEAGVAGGTWPAGPPALGSGKGSLGSRGGAERGLGMWVPYEGRAFWLLDTDNPVR
jgi:hypothetical protein